MNPLRPSEPAALAAWAERVRANRKQVERVREASEDADFYAGISEHFRSDPHRTDEAALDALRSLVRPADTWLDIGAGGGRYALPLALAAREVIALDPSPGMLEVLRQGIAEYQLANVRIVLDRWPAAEPIRCDVALIAHVGYDIEAIGPFLNVMERNAARLCVAILVSPQPTFQFDLLWPAVHGQARAALPALPEFIALQLARGRLCEVRLTQRPPQSFGSYEQAVTFARRQTWTLPDSAAGKRLQSVVAERLSERDGRFAFDWSPVTVGVVSWTPALP